MNRRDILKTAVVAPAAAVALPLSARTAAAGGSDRPAFVLIHGSWHGAWTWNEMTPLLAEAGYASIAIDLPGAGTRTRFPESFLKRPLDMAAFAIEPSPVAGVTQSDRTAAAVAAVNQAAGLGNGKVVIVGPFLGRTDDLPCRGSDAGQDSRTRLSGGLHDARRHAGRRHFRRSELQDWAGWAAVHWRPGKDRGHSASIRAHRTPDYVAKSKQAFYHDVSDGHFAAIANLLHCDEVASTAGVPMAITAARYGKVTRHYIRLADDRAVPAEAQDRMVELVDTSAVGGMTTVHRMAGSHSPFFAQPEALLAVFDKIAG